MYQCQFTPPQHAISKGRKRKQEHIITRNCEFVYGNDLIQQIPFLFTRSSGKPLRMAHVVVVVCGRDG